MAGETRPGGRASIVRAIRDHVPLLRDIAGTSGARIYSTLISFATLALTARWLGPEGRGIVVVITTWAGLIAGIAHLSIGQVLVHRAANNPTDDWIGPAVQAVVAITAVATLAGWAALALVYGLFADELFAGIPGLALAVGLGALPFLIWEQYGSAMLSIVGRLRTYNIAQIAGRSLGLLLLMVTIGMLGLGIYGFLVAFIAAQAVVALTGVTALIQHSGLRLRGGLHAIGALVRDGLKLHLNAIGVLLFSGVDILMLQYFKGPEAAAIFQLPMQLFLALLLVPQAAQLALQGRVASRSRTECWPEHRMVMVLIVALMGLGAAVLWALAPWIVKLVGGQGFAESAAVFRILLIGVPVACFNTLMAIQWITRGLFLQASMATLATGVINCLLNLVLIPANGAIGAAYAALIGMCAVPLLANGWLAASAQREFAKGEGK